MELFIVDDHKMLLNGLKNYLEENSHWKVTGIFTSSCECLNHLATITDAEKFPQVIIVDVQLGKESGFELVEKITQGWPQIKCIIYYLSINY